MSKSPTETTYQNAKGTRAALSVLERRAKSLVVKHKGNAPLERQKPMVAGRQQVLRVYRKRNQLVAELPLLVRAKLVVRNGKRGHHVLNAERYL